MSTPSSSDSPAFALDPRIESGALPVGDLALSSVLLMNDARFPWLMLVPRRAGASEIADLDPADAQALMDEIRLASRVLAGIAKPDKINVGSLGNMVPQLHVHVIARFRSDPAWPGPVWGFGTARPYPAHAATALVERLGAAFAAA